MTATLYPLWCFVSFHLSQADTSLSGQLCLFQRVCAKGGLTVLGSHNIICCTSNVHTPVGEWSTWNTPPSSQKEMTGRGLTLTTETWRGIQVFAAERRKSSLVRKMINLKQGLNGYPRHVIFFVVFFLGGGGRMGLRFAPFGGAWPRNHLKKHSTVFCFPGSTFRHNFVENPIDHEQRKL